ncbi:hypothetical protein CF326_g7283 [Tilletia indica]|nr:hypothetical protein CF326_g7283 [Tilletia indica]
MPMVTPLNSPSSISPKPTFRLRDRSLLAPWILPLVPLQSDLYKHGQALQLMEATVLRLWEPSPQDYQEIKSRHSLRSTSPLVLLDSTVSSSVDDLSGLRRDKSAVCLPSRSIKWITASAEALKISLPSPEGVRSDFSGSPLLVDWLLNQGDAWIKFLFGSGVHGTRSLPLPAGVEPALIQSLRVVPNLFQKIISSTDANWASLSAYLQGRNLVHIYEQKSFMLWEGLGPRIDYVSCLELEMLAGNDRFEIPFAPLPPGEWAIATAGALGIPHSFASLRAHQQLQELSASSPFEAPPSSSHASGVQAINKLKNRLLHTVIESGVRLKADTGPVVPATVADRVVFAGAKTRQAVDAATSLSQLLDPFLSSIIPEAAASSDDEEATQDVSDIAYAFTSFFLPLFRVSNWTPAHGSASRRSAYRYFNGFNPDFAWHLFGPATTRLTPPIKHKSWLSQTSSLSPLDQGFEQTRLQFTKWLIDASAGKGPLASELKESTASPCDLLPYTLDRLYERVLIYGPYSDSFGPDGLNVRESETIPLKSIWKMLDGRLSALSPQPLVFSWGQARNLWPSWAASAFFSPQTSALMFSSVSRLFEKEQGPQDTIFTKYMLQIPQRLSELGSWYTDPRAKENPHLRLTTMAKSTNGPETLTSCCSTGFPLGMTSFTFDDSWRMKMRHLHKRRAKQLGSTDFSDLDEDKFSDRDGYDEGKEETRLAKNVQRVVKKRGKSSSAAVLQDPTAAVDLSSGISSGPDEPPSEARPPLKKKTKTISPAHEQSSSRDVQPSDQISDSGDELAALVAAEATSSSTAAVEATPVSTSALDATSSSISAADTASSSTSSVTRSITHKVITPTASGDSATC